MGYCSEMVSDAGRCYCIGDQSCEFCDFDYEPLEGPDKEQGRKNKINEVISIMYARYSLKDQGFEAVNVKRKILSNKDELNEEWINRLLASVGETKNKIIDLIKKNLTGIPDLICLKDNKISFVEVKSNSSQLKEEQKKVIQILQDNGYPTKIMRFFVNFEIKELP